MSVSRLFIALWPPPEVLESLRVALAPLQAQTRHLRWQPLARWHITVAFLADREEQRAVEVFKSLHLATPEPVALAAAGSFGPVLWIGLRGGEWISTMAHEARSAYRIRERRGYRAHMTVARARSAAAQQEAAEVVARLGAFVSEPWCPGELTLVRSSLGPAPEYEVIARSSLPETP